MGRTSETHITSYRKRMEEAVSDARANVNGGELLSLDDKGCATGLRHRAAPQDRTHLMRLRWMGCM